jgi:hypothetical protein
MPVLAIDSAVLILLLIAHLALSGVCDCWRGQVVREDGAAAAGTRDTITDNAMV